MAAYEAHGTAVIDPGCTIGDGTRIWHFSHIMPGCTIGTKYAICLHGLEIRLHTCAT